MMFRDQVGVLAGWFKGWNECEQTVALLTLLKRVSRTQARFLQICLEHSLADCTEIHILEGEANDAAFISQWQQDPKEKVVSQLLSHLPLLQPGNVEAKSEYMKLLQKVLAYSIDSNLFIEESRQLLSYALIHPATSLDDRSSLALWLTHLEERMSSNYSSPSMGRADSIYTGAYNQNQRHNVEDKLNEWQNRADSSMCVTVPTWLDKPMTCENGHLPLHTSVSVPSAMNNIGSNSSTVLQGQTQTNHSPLKRSVSLTPPINMTNQSVVSEWMSPDDLRSRAVYAPSDHAPLSPQSSIASSGSGGSEQTEEQGSSRNTFQEEGSGMKDVPTWLKSLRLHKYASLFSQLTYEEMMTLTEHQLESQNVTKGARHKIALSIQKLRERQGVLKSLEKDILEGGNLRNALQELQQIIITPIKAYTPPQLTLKEGHDTDSSNSSSSATGLGTDSRTTKAAAGKETTPDGFQSQIVSTCDGESTAAPVSEGDIPGQFTRVMGKVCTQLLVSRPDEENISSYLQLLEKCLAHEAFTETQKKRLFSWKQQVFKLLRSFPRKALLEMPGVRQRSWGFGQSSSLPTAGSVVGGLSRRGQRPFQVPPRGLSATRMGLMGTSAANLGGVSPRHTLNPLASQGRQNLWFANPGGSNSMPSQSRSSVQRTYSLPVHTSPQAILMFQQSECQVPVTEPEINTRLESLCLSMTEHALGDGVDKTSTI
ncbi:protein Smaug homolog 1-like isoform X1 [Leucoraja erinacea]|uniref:protein Smaug homolog 1-like isoform X1 n=1 Tax=Leucoraja erinaceus TaxID=7782 RepID=UPI002458F6E3|nr:protein Smaug homolog 1-like isoform X1 [Leucoraja erinacea]XP_055519506.1 protein Smaug homolog 1-like isoform X1 [Leucoraja erinacea]